MQWCVMTTFSCYHNKSFTFIFEWTNFLNVHMMGVCVCVWDCRIMEEEHSIESLLFAHWPTVATLRPARLSVPYHPTGSQQLQYKAPLSLSWWMSWDAIINSLLLFSIRSPLCGCWFTAFISQTSHCAD